MQGEAIVPVWFAGWVVVAAAALVRIVLRRRRLRRLYGGAAIPANLSGAVRKTAPYVLLFGASTCLVLLFAQIRLSRTATTASVVLAIDVSDSMLATDVQPDRFTAAKAAATSFLEEVPDSFRVGVVTFAGRAAVVAEPTARRAETTDAIEGLAASRGTVIGDGLATALATIDADRGDDPDLPAAVVLLSDGADTGSVVAPAEAAAEARALGVPVFTVAIVSDREEGGDTQLLQAIAADSGGSFSAAASAGELDRVYDALGARLTSELAVGSSATPLLVSSMVMTAVAAAIFLGAGRRSSGR
jgi:Ca-activated chloride channel homolog